MGEAVNKEYMEEDSDSEEEAEEMHAHPGKAHIATTSLIMDKYKEDSSKPTVANRVADMVVQFETFNESLPLTEDVVEPEDELFPEDEEVTGQIDEDDEIENAIMMIELSDVDHEKLEEFKLLRKDVLRFSSVVPEDHCRCVNVRICAEVANSLKKLQDLKTESNELNTLIEQCIAKTDE